MLTNSINSTNFNGMWAPVKVLKAEQGVYYKNKEMFTLYDIVYHPWVDETKESIKNEVEKYFFGRSFSIWDTYDNHYKADLFQMNRINIGSPIKYCDKKNLLENGYTTELKSCTPDDNEFKKIYPNGAYNAFDVVKMNSERVIELANKYFPTV